MQFVEQIEIGAAPSTVFDFLARKHECVRPDSSPVRRLDKVTPGPVGVGTRFVEEVRMLPGIIGTIHSEVTVFDPGRALVERFQGAGLAGTMRYRFEKTAAGTRLVHAQDMRFQGLFAALNVVLLPVFRIAMHRRLKAIRDEIEAREARGS